MANKTAFSRNMLRSCTRYLLPRVLFRIFLQFQLVWLALKSPAMTKHLPCFFSISMKFFLWILYLDEQNETKIFISLLFKWLESEYIPRRHFVLQNVCLKKIVVYIFYWTVRISYRFSSKIRIPRRDYQNSIW